MRRRDIIIAGPYAAEIAVNQALAPAYAALNPIPTDMAGIRRLAAVTQTIHDVLDDHTPNSADKLFRTSQRRERQSYDSAHQWKCRALGLNPATTPTLALGGMTPINLDGWLLGIAVPAPSPMTIDMTEIVTLVLLDPKTGAASVYKDKAAQLIEPANTRKFTVHADARVWARDFARQRLEHVRTAQQARRIANIPPVWSGRPPSALAVGSLTKIDWPFFEELTAGEGIDVKKLNSVIRRPRSRVHAPMNLRTAA